MNKKKIKRAVRDRYGEIATSGGSCGPSPCCGSGEGLPLRLSGQADRIAKQIGYSDEDLAAVPEDANLGLGCGNPVALASLKEGETVLDLGSGAGFDAFLAARRVGKNGKVIGVDMTYEMVMKARANAARTGVANVEFRVGEIEHLPVADETVDVIISNCVINLSTDKPQVFRDAYRVLKTGGRVMISDMMLTADLPEEVRQSASTYVACIGGAIKKEEYLSGMAAAGFRDIEVIEETPFPAAIITDETSLAEIAGSLGLSPERVVEAAQSIISAKIRAVK